MNKRAYHMGKQHAGDGEDQVAVEPGPFPIDALNGVQKRIVEDTAHVHQIDVALPGMAAVATLAGAIGKGHVIHGAVNGRDTYCNVSVLAGAPKSYGKNAASTITRPLIDASADMAEDFRVNQRPDLVTEQRTLEARYKKMLGVLAGDSGKNKDPITESDKRDLRVELTKMQSRMDAIAALVRLLPSYWIGSSTTAGLVDFLARNGETIFSFSPEAGELVRIALGKFSKDNAADFDLLLSGYTVEPFRETRVGRGDNLLTPCITSLWFCQPFLLRELAGNEEALERGLTARALAFVCEHGEIPEDDGIVREVSAVARAGWNQMILDVLSTRTAPEPTIIQCSTEAREIFRAWHNESVRLRNGPYRDIEGELGRWRENAVRLAGGQCVADRFEMGPNGAGMNLTADHARRGVLLARWACRSTLTMMEIGREARRLSRVQSLVQLVLDSGGKITLRDLNVRHGYGRAEVLALARDYPHLLIVQRAGPGKDGGRPSEVLTIPGRA